MGAFAGSFVLVVAAAAVVAGARGVCLALGEARGSVAAAVAVALFAGVVPVVAAVTGTVAAVVVLGVACAVVAAVLDKRRALPVGAAVPVPWSRAARSTSAALFTLLAVVALTTHLWDEASTHLPLAGAVARDVWPLEHPLFPGQPLRYHPGFAVVGGVVRAFTGLPLPLCLDVVTLLGIALLLWGIHDLACAVGMTSTQAAWALPLVLLAGGPLAAILADGWGAPLPLKGAFPSGWVNGAVFPPLVVTNVFQHPQGLALPLACAALVVGAVPGHRRLPLAALLVLLCARVQIVIAAFTGLALVVLVLRRRSFVDLVALAVVAVVVVVDSGFVAGGGEFAAGGYFAADGVGRGVVHNLVVFGVSLGAPLYAVWLFRRGRGNDLVVALAVVGSVGFVVGNAVHYARSWDIVKLFGVSAFFAHVLFAAWLLLQRRAVVVVVVAVVSCWSGAFWLLRHGVLNGVVAAPYREQGLDERTAAFLDVWGPHIPGDARVFAPGLQLGRAGFLVPGTDWKSSRDTAALLLDRAQAERMTIAWKEAKKNLDDGALAALGVSFVVVDASNIRRELADRSRFERVDNGTDDDADDDAGFAVFRVLHR